MTFQSPNAFWLLLVLIPLVHLLFLKQKKGSALLNPIFQILKKENKNNTLLKIVDITKKILLIVITILMIVVIARPQEGYEEEESTKKGIDIIIALDISESMLTDDLKPNRINAAKDVIIDFISKLKSDRLGVVVFAGKPFTQSPLTFDYPIITQYLEELSTDSINQNVRGLSGTAIGDAILSSITKLEKEEERSKVIVLLTDGEANTGVDPIIASKMAKDKNIKIYTIGIGQKEGYPMSYTDQFGQKQYYSDMYGNIVKTYLDEKMLKEVANVTNAKYYLASDNNALNEIFEDINKLEKTEIESNKITKYKENYLNFSFAILLFLIGYIVLDALKPRFI